MPFQPIDFANIEPQGSPWMRDFVKNLSAGYEAGQMPAKMERQKQQEELANALAKFNYEKAPEKFKAEMTRDNLLNSLTSLQIQNAREDRDPAFKVRTTKAYIDALKGSGVNVTPDMELGYYRKSLGLDEQSPTEKMSQTLALERAKNLMKNKDDLTTTTKTANQTIIRGVDATLPTLSKLIKIQTDREVPGQIFGHLVKRDRQTTYNSMISLITDSLVSAYGLPKTNESLHLVSQMVARQWGESDKNYDERLKNLTEELKARKIQAQNDIGRPTGQTLNLATGAYE